MLAIGAVLALRWLAGSLGEKSVGLFWTLFGPAWVWKYAWFQQALEEQPDRRAMNGSRRQSIAVSDCSVASESGPAPGSRLE